MGIALMGTCNVLTEELRDIVESTTRLDGKRVLMLAFDLFGTPGGIASHGRMVVRALEMSGCDLTVEVLNDPLSVAAAVATRHPSIRYTAHGGVKSRFMTSALTRWRTCPDIVLLEHPHLAPIGWSLSRAARAKLAVFVHGIDIWDTLEVYRRLPLRGADLVLCVSRTSLERGVAAHNLVRGKIAVLYNCLDPSIELSPYDRPDPHRLSMLTVARITLDNPYKGHEQVIRVLPELRARFPTVHYDIVGDGDGRATLEGLVHQLNLTDAVTFHGFVSAETLTARYASASVFVMPSQSEGFGYVFLEAMAHHLPVIAGNADASSEVVVDGETGFVVDPSSLPAVRDAAALLLEDWDLRRRMGRAAADRVERYFTFDRFQKRLITALNSVAIDQSSSCVSD